MTSKRPRRLSRLVLTSKERESVQAARSSREKIVRAIAAGRNPFNVILEAYRAEAPDLLLCLFEQQLNCCSQEELKDYGIRGVLLDGVLREIDTISPGYQPVKNWKKYPLISKFLEMREDEAKRKLEEEERARGSWAIDPSH